MKPSKATIPYKKQIYRLTDTAGNYAKDRVTLWNEEVSEGKPPLLVPVIEDGELVYEFPTLQDIQTHTTAELKRLPDSHKQLTDATPYAVELHSALRIYSQ